MSDSSAKSLPLPLPLTEADIQKRVEEAVAAERKRLKTKKNARTAAKRHHVAKLKQVYQNEAGDGRQRWREVVKFVGLHALTRIVGGETTKEMILISTLERNTPYRLVQDAPPTIAETPEAP